MWAITPAVTGTTTAIGIIATTVAGDQADTGTGPRIIAGGMTATHTTQVAAADVTTDVEAEVMADVTATMGAMMMTVTTIAVTGEETPAHATMDKTTISTATNHSAPGSPTPGISKHVRQTAMLTIPAW